MKNFFKEIIKDILLFVTAILVYEMLLVLIFPNLELVGTRLEAIKEDFRFIFTGEVFNYPKFLGIFVIFVGIPVIIIRRLSNRLSNKLNFTIVPSAIIIVFLLILPSIYVSIFKLELPLPKFLDDLLKFYTINSAAFLLVYSLFIAIWTMIKRKKQIILAQ